MADTPCDDRLNGRDVSSTSTLDHLSFVAVAVVVIAVDVLNDRIKLRDMNLELDIHFDSEPEKFELLKLDNNFVLILKHERCKTGTEFHAHHRQLQKINKLCSLISYNLVG